MTKTATRSPAASKPSVKPVKDVEVELDITAGTIIADLQAARLAKSVAEAKEKVAKERLNQLLPKHKKNTRLILKVAGEIRGKVSWRKRSGLDADLLMQGWPEAYTACKTESEFTVIN